MLKPQKQYYCLVAGLPEFSFDGATLPQFDLFALRAQIAEELSVDDLKAMETLYRYYDISNLVSAIKGSNIPFNKLGNLTPQEIQEEIDAPRHDDEPFQTKLPSSIAALIDNYKGRLDMDATPDSVTIAEEELENHLWMHYYQTAAASASLFIRQWSATDRSVRNIIAACGARNLGIDPMAVMVGDGELEQQISTSSAADFGLRGEFEYFEALWNVIETTDFVERERKMDSLRWNMASQLTDQDYFNIDFLMGYMVRLNIIYRWISLDKEIGATRFKEIVDSFTADVQL